MSSLFRGPRHGGRILSFLALAAGLALGARATAARPVDSKPTEKASLHLHGGLFSPIDANSPSPTVGVRLSKVVSPHLQVGALTGWTLQRTRLTEPRNNGLPGSKPEIVLARTDKNLVPFMGFLRVHLTEKHWLVPYFGAGSGLEWLSVRAVDYRTDRSVTTTYVNWAWEGWVGLGFRVGRQLRMNGELFYNGGSLEYDVSDETGQTRTEIVNVDGAGARLGLDFIFQ